MREMERHLQEVGYPVSYDSIRNYERGRTVPAGYVGAVVKAFHVSADWLLFGWGPVHAPTSRKLQEALEELSDLEPWEGKGGASPAEGEAQRNGEGQRDGAGDRRPSPGMELAVLSVEVRRRWERFARELGPEHPLRDVILASWARSERAAVDPDPSNGPRFRKVPEAERRDRSERNRTLLRAVRPHMEWLSPLLGEIQHVLSLSCRDGIILLSETNAPSLREDWGLLPGYDSSESEVGTNGAGTALAEDRVVAVVGAEHFQAPFHDRVQLAAPLRDPTGRLAGALELTTPLSGGRPERLTTVAYAARMVERELATLLEKGEPPPLVL